MEGNKEIPGFYYDKDKGKYFKIQSSGAAPASAAYSSTDVKRRRLNDERSEAVAFEKSLQKGRIQRAKILTEPAFGGVLARELGTSNFDGSPIVAGGLEYQGFSDRAKRFFHSHRNGHFHVQPRPDIEPFTVDIRMVTEHFCGFRMPLNNTSDGNDITRSRVYAERLFSPNIDSIAYMTSLTANEPQGFIMATWSANTAYDGIVITTLDRTKNDDIDRRTAFTTATGNRGVNQVDALTSTAAPEALSMLFAVGTSHGIKSFDDRVFNSSFPNLGINKIESPSTEVFALEFLTKNNPAILLSGNRRGILHINDLRTRGAGRASGAIHHPSTITHIRMVDGHHVVVAGLQSSLCQYDLRFSKPTAAAATTTAAATSTAAAPLSTTAAPTTVAATATVAGRRHRTRRPDGAAVPTRPILEYAGYSNAATISHGLEVDLESGVLAVAQEHDSIHAPVQLYSLRGGQMLQPLKLEMKRPLDADQVVKCVRWVEDVEGKAKSLYFMGNGIHRYSWSGDTITMA